MSKLRVAEFVIHIMASIKSDLSHQGAKADFTRVENYLKGKWTLWTLRVKFAVEVTLYNLQVCSVTLSI